MDFKLKIITYTVLMLASTSNAGVSPAIPGPQRTEYFFIANDNLGYKYGYDTGSGIYSKQIGNAENQVVGQYAYPDSNGKTVVVNYRSGPEGFIPEGYERMTPNTNTFETQESWQNEKLPEKKNQFSYSTSDSNRHKASDDLSKEEGKYLIQNKGSKIDVTYTADGKMGFAMANENTSSKQISWPSSLPSIEDLPSLPDIQDFPQLYPGGGDGDDTKNNGAYSFQYSNPDSSRVESSDANGNMKGQYSYTNAAGKHDLSYIAGPGVGFQPTGGSLAQPNGLSGEKFTKQISWPSSLPSIEDLPSRLPDIQDFPQLFPGGGGGDGDDIKNNGAYSFQYSNPESSRVESSDANGNIKGQYSYTNAAGTHDLSYIAGPGVGFQPTGGSLAQPNGLSGKKFTKQISWPSSLPSIEDLPSRLPDIQDFPQLFPGGGGGDGDDIKNNGAYSFQYSNPESSRVESSDANGNIKGQYSYTNAAGTHDLSYIAGPGVGFQPTGGSLAQPNGLSGEKFTKQISWPSSLPSIEDLPSRLPDIQDFPQLFPGGGGGDGDDIKNNGAYSFQYSNPESSRVESSDANGNIKGQYSYTNAAGTHDLSYIAGPGVGFQPTGGSLAQPNGLSGKKFTKQISWPSSLPSIEDLPSRLPDIQDFPQLFPGGGGGDGDDIKNNGAYSFQYSNPESSRVESSDANGNIKGQYSYTNAAGTHDLSYIAGPGVGFQPTGGSLAQPNGLSGKKFTKQISWPSSLPSIEDLPSRLPDIQDFPQLFPGGGGGDGDDIKNNGAYSFQYSNPESSRVESSDANGNIKGQYSYTNAAGTHDLSYIAGPGVGFQPTGGSLAQPNGLSGKKFTKQISWPSSLPSIEDLPSRLPDIQDFPQLFPGGGGGDGDDIKNNGAYSFQYSNPESSRVESSDTNGNIKGQYSYTNAAVTHDLSYIAGPGVGFQPTGGSLAQPNGLSGEKFTKQISWPSSLPSIEDLPSRLPDIQDFPQLFPGGGSDDGDDIKNNGAYSFQYSNPESSRVESSDANGNIKGYYSYTNAAGTHDLSYIAEPGVGFQPTGGSLAQPNGLKEKILLIDTSPKKFPSSSPDSTVLNNMKKNMYKTQPELLYLTPQAKFSSPISYSSDEEASVETFFPPGQHGKIGYVIRYKH